MNRILLLLLAVLGLGCSVLAVRYPWFAVPADIATADDGKETVVAAVPAITAYYQAAAVVLGVVLFVLWLFGKRAFRVSPAVACLWMTAILTYPYAVMVWDPVLAGKAAWMESEHRNLIWSGGDVNNAMEYRLIGAIDKLMASDTPGEIEPTLLGDWQVSDWSLALLPDLVDRLGYSDRFFEFLCRGWILALAGATLMVVVLCVPGAEFDATRSLVAFGTFVGSFLLACLVAWSFSFQASKHLASAAEQVSQCRYEQALDELQLALEKHPSLREHTYFVAQVGLLEAGLHYDTPEARLYRANVLERGSRYQQAEAIYGQLLRELPPESPVRRESCRALLRSAINDINSGRTGTAVRRLEELLAADPCNLKVNYLLQIGYLRTDRPAEVAPLVDRMSAIYEYFQYFNKAAVIYAAHSNAMIAEYNRGDLDLAILQARKSIEQ